MSAVPPPGTEPAGPSLEGPPVCPRHPDRVSYVRCQRCERPTCPECQRPAPVGVHCVDCVRQSTKATAHQRTVFGARLRSGPTVVTYVLIGLNLVSFLLQNVLGSRDNPWFQALALSPAIGEHEPWRFLTTAFLHNPSSLFHIGFNMYALWSLGQVLEPALGRARYLTLYVVSALGGNVMYVLLSDSHSVGWYTAAIGASGAVFGLFAAFFVLLRRMRRDPRSVIVLLVINGVLGFVLPNIAWQAHLGGFLVGLALGTAYAYAPKDRRALVSVAVPVALVLALVVLAGLKYAWA